MNTHADKTQENKSQSVANAFSQKQSDDEFTFQLVDNRPEAVAQRKLQEMANNSPQVLQLRTFNEMTNNSVQSNQVAQLKSINEYSTIHCNQVIQPMFRPRRELDHKEATSSGYTTGAGAWTEEIYDDDETEVTGKLDAFGKSYSFKGTHAETALIEALGNDIDSLSGDEFHLVIWISKSPCTSTERDGFPKTNSTGMGCTERLAALANNGLRGKTFKITIIAHHLYQPSVRGGKNASRAALRYLKSLPNVNGVSLEQGQYEESI